MDDNIKNLILEISSLGTKEKTASKKADSAEGRLIGVLNDIASDLEKTAMEGEESLEEEEAAEEAMEEAEAEEAMGEGAPMEGEGEIPPELLDAAAAEEAGPAEEIPQEEIVQALAEAIQERMASVKPKKSKKTARSANVKKVDVQKLAASIAKLVKQAVEGPATYGLGEEMTSTPDGGKGQVQEKAQQKLDADTGDKKHQDEELVAGPTDPLKGVAPQPFGGEQKPLQGGELKAAMAKMSNEDVEMIFKLASVGYDVTVDTISTEIANQKIAEAQQAEAMQQQKIAEAVQNVLHQEKLAQQQQYQQYLQQYYNTYGQYPQQ